MTRWLVDGMNVIGSRPDGWWHDREGAKRDLAARLADFAQGGDEVTVVFDGRELEPPIEAGRIEVRYAAGGPNSADDRIVEIVGADPDPASITVVTSDGELGRRVADSGASVVGAGEFRRRL